jgi:integrase
MMNIRVNDLEWNEKNGHYTLNIREEVSKTFGRRIKLLLCSGLLREYIANKRLKPETYLFTKMPAKVNQYLKYLGFKVLKIGEFKGTTQMKNGKYNIITDGLTMYDFRHAAACYWLPRYKSESALKYRFGWKKSDMIHYYTELLGMHDTIQEDDLYVDVTKTELERQLQEKSNDITLLQEQVKNQDEALQEVMALLQALRVERQIKSHTPSETITITNKTL